MDITLVLLEISILIFFAELMRTSLRKFVPSIVGEIIAGMVLSPFAVGGLLDHILNLDLFSLNQYLLFLSEFSMILLIFSSGLEHGVSAIRSAGTFGFLGATAGALFPALVGILVFQGIGFDTSLILGTAIGATSLASAGSIISELRLKGKGVDLLMSMASSDDVVDLILLSVVLGTLAGATSVKSIATLVIYYIVAWIVIFVVAVRVIPMIANRLDEVYIEEFSMLVIFGLTAIMTALNFSPVISAFIAGVAMAESVKKERVRQIIDVLLAVFGSAFFVVVGLQVNLSGLTNFWLMAVELTVIAVIFKILGVLPFAYLGLRKWRSALAVSLAMVPRGETGLVVGSIGLSYNALNQNEFGALVFMAIPTTVIGASFFKGMAHWLREE
ncbi:MAG: cation:proton antiporter [Metallosphaera prunae]|uniref:cation:proton antiporter n=1 Tax=Metallosphaera prunae TaxID=47304 RepID=UPI00227630B0|nr:cation:proton antiporter [Metallosphaera prunae]MCY0863041.1 cation:proton antiporter [Metallosphaera prunae]